MMNNLVVSMMMNKLQQSNPQAYNQINAWMRSGKNPKDIINQLVQSGQVTQTEVSKAEGVVSEMLNNNQKRF